MAYIHPGPPLRNDELPKELVVSSADGSKIKAYEPSRGECHIDTTSKHGMSCDKCGARWLNYMLCFHDHPLFGDGAARTRPNFCPNCGARAVDK